MRDSMIVMLPVRASRAARVLTASAALFHAGVVLADIPPPSDQKTVSFSFTVKGAGVAPDRVIFAYPCSGSNGAPFSAQQKVEEGRAITVGRRGGPCTLYATARTTYDAWLKEHPDSPPQGKQADFDKLVAESVKCTGAPTPTFYISKTDARSSIAQTIEVTKLDATTCTLKVEPVAPEVPSPTAATSKPSSSSRGCAIGETPAERPTAWGLAFLSMAALVAWRQGARSRRMEGT